MSTEEPRTAKMQRGPPVRSIGEHQNIPCGKAVNVHNKIQSQVIGALSMRAGPNLGPPRVQR